MQKKARSKQNNKPSILEEIKESATRELSDKDSFINRSRAAIDNSVEFLKSFDNEPIVQNFYMPPERNSPNLVKPQSIFEIVFNRDDKRLYKIVGKKEIEYRFGIGKRFSLFEYLLDNDGYTQTNDLKRVLSCSDNVSVRKIAQGINDKVKNIFNIKKRIVDGREGLGYRINPCFYIAKE